MSIITCFCGEIRKKNQYFTVEKKKAHCLELCLRQSLSIDLSSMCRHGQPVYAEMCSVSVCLHEPMQCL